MFTRDNILMYEKHINNQREGIVLPIYQDNEFIYGDARYMCNACGVKVKAHLTPREPIEQVKVICPGCEKITRVGELNIFLN